ncbi:MAG: tetratricopeptide repeat protein [Gemmatimonadaceae bacterium]
MSAAGVIALAASAPSAAAQAATLGDALDLESAGSYRQAAAVYRGALGGTDLASALLGLERVYAAIGWTDSLLPVIDSLIGERPSDPLLQSVRLRALTMSGREQRAEAMFEQWVERSRGDARPFREYARLLLDGGRIMAADSVLQRAQGALGSGREVALELAQLRAQLGLWELSARSWREALGDSPYLVQAAVFALQPTAAAARDPVRKALAAEPPLTAASQALARLELSWGDAAAGWRALRPLPPTDSTVDAWIAFAGEAEAPPARAAAAAPRAAAAGARPSAELRARAALAALRAGRPGDALALTERAGEGGPATDSAARLLLPVRVRVLSALGRPDDAARLVDDAARGQPALAAGLQRELAWAWVRAGDLERARQALLRAGADPEDEVHGWLALYAGDLRGARLRLRATDAAPAYVVTALALLGRARADSAPAVGEAFLALARGDSATAASAFARAADALPDAAPLLLAGSARLAAGRGDEPAAIAAWERIASQFPDSPEAAEADLGWARLLHGRGDDAAAAERLEHLILSYPESALVPQARRELELLSTTARGAPAPTQPPAAPAPASPRRPPP